MDWAISDLNRNQETRWCTSLEFDCNGSRWSLIVEPFFIIEASRNLVSLECCIFNFPDVFHVKFTGMAISVNAIHCSVEWYQTWTAVSSFKEHSNKAKSYGAEQCEALFQETSIAFENLGKSHWFPSVSLHGFWMKLVLLWLATQNGLKIGYFIVKKQAKYCVNASMSGAEYLTLAV